MSPPESQRDLTKTRHVGFVAPIEYFELAQKQEEFLTTHVKSAEADLLPQVVSFLHQILRKFVQETVASVVSGDLCPPKEEPETKVPSKELLTSKVKDEFPEAKKTSSPENPGTRNLPQQEFDEAYNSIYNQLELYYTALFNENPKGRDVEQTPVPLVRMQSASAASSLAATPKSGTGSETIENTQASKMRQVLDFSYRVLFDTDLDTLVFTGPFALDNLMEVAEDFTNQLASVLNPVCHLQQTPMEASNVSFTASGSGNASGSGPSGTSEKSGSSSAGGGGNGRGGRNPGDGKSPRGMEAPGKPGSSGPTSRFRFPCPFRMKDPYTFNVREYYSCSMTFFSDLKSLK